MEKNDESIEAVKRIKQLENQNLKLKRLLQTAIDIYNQDSIGTLKLRNENHDLAKTINNLEEEKRRLEYELTEILQKNESGMVRALRKLELEHSELQDELHTVLTGISEEQTELEQMEAEEQKMKLALVKLDQERTELLEKIRELEEKRVMLPEHNQKHEKAQTTSKPTDSRSLSSTLASDDNIVTTFIKLEQMYKEYIDVLEQHTLDKTISDLITKTEKLATGVQESTSEPNKPHIKINQTILYSNSNILNKIKDVKSKLATSIEKNSAVLSSCDESNLISIRVSEMEKERDLIYDELEEYLQNSSKDIALLAVNVHDAETKLLVHEIEVQKAVLLYNLKMIKLKDQTKATTNLEDPPDILAPPCSQASLESKDTHEIKHLYSNDNGACQKTSSSNASSVDHHRLEEIVIKLENEKRLLLKQLNAISGSSSQRYEERELQTQSELHSTFMREESSEEMVVTKNLDDATNQLLTEEDIRLEQRIRELEIDNKKIRKEVQRLMESSEDTQVPAQTLKERIEELEQQTQSKPQIQQE